MNGIISLDDLIGAGFLGLVEASKKYDQTQGAFMPYAIPRIRGAMLDEMRTGDIVPRRMRNQINKRLIKNPIRVPMDLAENVHCSGLSPERNAELSEQARLVADQLKKLTPPLKKVHALLFIKGKTLNDAAKKLGVSHSRISQIKASLITLIREAVNR